MEPLHARSAVAIFLVASSLLAEPALARANDTAASAYDRCEAYPNECRARPVPRISVALDWVRPAPPNPLRAPHGWQLGMRLGVAHPGGTLGGGSIATTPRMSDIAETWAPVGLDAGYRLVPALYLGATLMWGGAFGDDNGLCAACGFRYDFQALTDLRLYPLPATTVNPWFAFGVGWEVMHVNFDSSGPTGTANYHGPVLGNFQIGVDARKAAVAIGPYFGVELAEFAFHSLNPSPAGESSSIGSTAIHEWFTVGIRASYGP